MGCLCLPPPTCALLLPCVSCCLWKVDRHGCYAALNLKIDCSRASTMYSVDALTLPVKPMLSPSPSGSLQAAGPVLRQRRAQAQHQAGRHDRGAGRKLRRLGAFPRHQALHGDRRRCVALHNSGQGRAHRAHVCGRCCHTGQVRGQGRGGDGGGWVGEGNDGQFEAGWGGVRAREEDGDKQPHRTGEGTRVRQGGQSALINGVDQQQW